MILVPQRVAAVDELHRGASNGVSSIARPGEDVAQSISYLSQFHKPIIPVGQAYDGAVDGGPAGPPSRAAIHRFMDVAEQLGAVGVSFWDWQAASQEEWDAIRDAPTFK